MNNALITANVARFFEKWRLRIFLRNTDAFIVERTGKKNFLLRAT